MDFIAFCSVLKLLLASSTFTTLSLMSTVLGVPLKSNIRTVGVAASASEQLKHEHTTRRLRGRHHVEEHQLEKLKLLRGKEVDVIVGSDGHIIFKDTIDKQTEHEGMHNKVHLDVAAYEKAKQSSIRSDANASNYTYINNSSDSSTSNMNHNIDIIDPQERTIEEDSHQNRRYDKSSQILPMGNVDYYNRTLFEELHNAPLEIYEASLATGIEARETSFPVFIVPLWTTETTGLFSGYSRTASTINFENIQFLLSWNDIVEASSGTDKPLLNFMSDCDFEASLFIGKIHGEEHTHGAVDSNKVPFLGLMVSYHQSSTKNILIPFAKIESFFHDSSEEYLLSESTQHIEHDALHMLLDEQRSVSNNTNVLFLHEAIVDGTANRREQLEDIEAVHFRRLFQLLIRRTFLFSYGYADCLRTEPHSLRECLDDTFQLVIQMEVSVRAALDNLLLEELHRITEISQIDQKSSRNAKVHEACVSSSGSSSYYGNGGCKEFGNLNPPFVSSLSLLEKTTAFR